LRLVLGLILLSSISHSISQKLFIVSSVSTTTQRLTPGTPISINEARNPKLPLLTFDPASTFQSIQGFGGAMTESSAFNLQSLKNDQLAQSVINAYYDPSAGNVYTITRVPMNSCDFCRASYTFDDVTDDFDLVHFDSKVTHDATTMIPFIQSAIQASQGQLNLFLSPWSPPAWMKGNNQMAGSSRPGLKADPRYHQAWANYYVKFISAYETHNITFWGATVQNDPEKAGQWESCVYKPEEMRDFIRDYLGPTVHKAYPNLRLMQYGQDKDHCVVFGDAVFSDSAASAHVWGTAIHWYHDPLYDNIQQLHNHWPTKHIISDEACNCGGVHLDDWPRGESYGIDIISDLNAWVEGWVDWNLVLDQKGGPNHGNNFCDASVIARLDLNPPSIHFQPNYYILGHFSRFLSPGALRINHTISGVTPMTFRVTTFRVDLNAKNPTHNQLRASVGADTGSYSVSVILNTAATASDIQVGVGSTFATVSVPAHSIHTIAFPLTNNPEIWANH